MDKYKLKRLFDINLITHLFYKDKCGESGYIHKDDSNVFNYDKVFGGLFGYTPQSRDLTNKTLSVKNQRGLSNCTIQAAVVQKEPDENIIGSVRVQSCYEFHNNLCQNEGWSSLENAQKAVKNFGLAEEGKFIEENTALSWSEYTNFNENNAKDNANQHRSQSYWKVSSRSNILQLLDQGKLLAGAITWYSGYNASGGRANYHYIDGFYGYAVGGHAFVIKGYKFIGNTLWYRCQNSYGADWGDRGDFYIQADFYDRYGYGCYANLDYEKSVAEIMNTYDGLNVKADSDIPGFKGAIFLVSGGYKIPYANDVAFVAINGYPYTEPDAFKVVPKAELEKIPTFNNGSPLTGREGKYWEITQRLKRPLNENFINN